MIPCMWTSIYYELSPEDAVRRISDLGWPAVELSTEHLVLLRDDPSGSARASEFGRVVRECGLTMDQAHITIFVDVANMDADKRRADQAIVRRDLEVLSALGIGHGVLHPGGHGRRETTQQAEEQNKIRAQAISDLADYAETLGVRIALENGMRSSGPDGEHAWKGTVEGIRELITQIGSPALGICLDTGHANLEGWDNAEAVRVAGDLLVALHIADNDGSGDQHLIPYCRGSKIKWNEVCDALRALGYSNSFNLEIPGERGRPLSIMDCAVRYALDVTQRLVLGEV